MCLTLTSKPVSDSIRSRILVDSQSFKRQHGRKPKLAVVLIGDDPASKIYTERKGKAAIDVGMEHVSLIFPNDASPHQVEQAVADLNNDATVDGILIQRPLPPQFKEQDVIHWVSPLKDVDGFHPENVGKLHIGLKGHLPCTPLGIMKILEHYKIDPAGKIACVVGRSTLVGKPAAALLMERNATVIQCHSRTPNLETWTSQADILVAAAGKQGIITSKHVKPGAVVIDVGIHRTSEGKVVGDVSPEVSEVASALTPVPGGVGPMTITVLLENTLSAAHQITDISPLS